MPVTADLRSLVIVNLNTRASSLPIPKDLAHHPEIPQEEGKAPAVSNRT